MKSQWFADKNRYEFAKCLKDADYSLQTWDLMDVFLKCSTLALRQSYRKLRFQEIKPEWEEEYEKSIGRVKNQENIKRCFAILVNALEEIRDDFLGSLIQELGQADKDFRGQCLTPTALCAVMSRMTLSEERPNPDRRLMLSEPACGGGAMVIAASQILMENGFYPWNYYWVCTDVDWRMFSITFIQCSLLGIPATVVHGNTLSLEQWDSAETFAAVMHPLRKQNVEEEPASEPLEPLAATVPEVVVDADVGGQLSLF